MKSDIQTKEEQSITKDAANSILKYFKHYQNPNKIVAIYPGKLVKHSGGVQVYKMTNNDSDNESRKKSEEWWKTNAVLETSYDKKFDI